jgi:hypothetical protein
MLELLALLPILHYFLLYFYSRPRKYDLFKTHSVQYLDWIFVPFNFLIPYAISFSWTVFLITLPLVTFMTFILHLSWKKRADSHVSESGRFTREGIIHLIFMSVQATLAGTLFISSRISVWYMVELLLLLAYLLGYLFVIKRILKKDIMHFNEGMFVIGGCVLVILRMIF